MDQYRWLKTDQELQQWKFKGGMCLCQQAKWTKPWVSHFFCLAYTMLTAFMQVKICIKCQGSPCTVSVKAMWVNTTCDLCHIMHRRCKDAEEKTSEEDSPNQGEMELSARPVPPAPMTQRGHVMATSVTRTRCSATPSQVPETVVDVPEPSGSRHA